LQRQRHELTDQAGLVLSAILDSVPHPPPPSASTEVALPSDTTDPWAEPRHLQIGLAADGNVTLEGKTLDSLAAFVGSLRRHAERGPTVATLFVASSVSHARVVEILELVRRVGIRDVGIEVAPPAEAGDPTTQEAERGSSRPPKPDRYGF
jgi:biopolymer transport protein ExbD